MVRIIDEQGFELQAKKGLALVDFNAAWCGPCQMLGPVLESLSEKPEGKMDFYSINVDDNQRLAMEYAVSSIPALLIMKDGVKLDMIVGFMPESALLEKLKAYI